MKRNITILVVALSVFFVTQIAFGNDVELTYMNFTMNEIPFEERLLEEFMEENPGIKVTVVTKPVDVFDRQIILSSRAGQAPDVFQARPSYTTSLGEMGLMENLVPFLEESPEMAASFTDAGMELGRLNDNQFGIPWRGGAWAVYVNGDVLREQGVAIPGEWTWSEFIETARILTKEGTYGFAFAGDPSDLGTAQSWSAHLAANGGSLFTKDGEIAVASDEAIRALQLYKDLAEEYNVTPPNVAALTYQEVVELFGQGRVAMFVNGPWFVATVQAAYPDVNLEIVPLPMDAPMGSVMSGTLLSMSPSTQHPEEAWKLIEFLTRPDNLLRWGEAGNFVPPLKDTSKAEYLNEPPLNVFVKMEQLPLTIQVGNLTNANELLRILGNGIQSVLIGNATPKEALNNVAEQWEGILGQ